MTIPVCRSAARCSSVTPTAFSLRCPLPTLRCWAASVVIVSTLVGCGQPPSGGMAGFPPPQVTTTVVQPTSLPVVFEYVGQTVGSKAR